MTARPVASGQSWPVASGQSWRRSGPAEHYVKGVIHLTDGRRYSRTGANLLALCGANVRPDTVRDEHRRGLDRECTKCRKIEEAR